MVAVYDAGVDGATRYIVMELVPGRDLSALLREQAPLATARAARIAAQIADALAAAHAAGIVHRDIKPANVMVGPDGTIRVLDFGVARAAGATQLTEVSTVLGTAAYMSPEQANGQPADGRSDIYSLGCLLYALLTGRPPFAGAAVAAVAQRQLNSSATPPRRLNPQVPSSLDALVMTMLAKAPAQRPQTAADVARSLRLLDAGPKPSGAPAVRRRSSAGVLAADATVTRVLARGSSRRPATLQALALVAAAALLAVLALRDPGGQSSAARGAQTRSDAARRPPASSAGAKVPAGTPTSAAPATATSSVAAPVPAGPGATGSRPHKGGADQKPHHDHGRGHEHGPGGGGESD